MKKIKAAVVADGDKFGLAVRGIDGTSPTDVHAIYDALFSALTALGYEGSPDLGIEAHDQANGVMYPGEGIDTPTESEQVG